MTKHRLYTEEDLRDVADNPEWTDEELATAKPLEALVPQLAAALREDRAQRAANDKQIVTLDLEQSVVDHFKSGGAGWQARMGEALKKAAGL